MGILLVIVALVLLGLFWRAALVGGLILVAAAVGFLALIVHGAHINSLPDCALNASARFCADWNGSGLWVREVDRGIGR